jgi:hypothetical protein
MNWSDFLENIAIQNGISAILMVIKNPAKAATLKQVLLHVADAIYSAYGITPQSGTAS